MIKITILSTMFLGVSAGAGWVYLPDSPDSTTNEDRAAGQASDQSRLVRGTGYVEPASELRRLVFKTDGVIGECPVDVGQVVRRGEVIISLVNAEHRAAVAVAEQELRVAIAQRDKALSGAHECQILAAQRKCDLLIEQARHDKKHFERVANLLKSKASTQEDFDRAQSDWRRSELSLRQAEAELMQLKKIVRPEDKQLVESQVALAQSRLASEKQRLANTMLVAPFDGTVLEIIKREGEGARNLEPVVVFGDESQLRVRAEIDERYVHCLQVGQTATVHGAGLGSSRAVGRIITVKRLMGKKTVFTHEATERKDLDVLQVLIEMPQGFAAPVGLQVDVDLEVAAIDQNGV